jgi:hypothetical protein
LKPLSSAPEDFDADTEVPTVKIPFMEVKALVYVSAFTIDAFRTGFRRPVRRPSRRLRAPGR